VPGGRLVVAEEGDGAQQAKDQQADFDALGGGQGRGGLMEEVGEENFFWASDEAIVEAERRKCVFCDTGNKG
jgi:hypothetical protein